MKKQGTLFFYLWFKLYKFIKTCLHTEEKEQERTLPCSIVGESFYGRKTRFFPKLFNIGSKNKIAFFNLWNKALISGEVLIKWGGSNLIFVPSVSLTSWVFLIIWSTLQYVPWVSFFYVFLLCSLTFHVNVIAKKSFLLWFVLAFCFRHLAFSNV